MSQALTKTVQLCDKTVCVCAWPGKVAAWLSLVIIGLSVFSILAGLFRWHTFLEWKDAIFLFGTELNSTSLVELQWHLFAVMMLFAGSYTYALDAHVRVDVLYSRVSDKTKLVINWIGDWFFLLPFALYMAWFSYDLVVFAYITGEGSSEMGLTHRWVVKAILPLAMSLLALQAFCRGLGGILRLVGACAGIALEPFQTEKEKSNE